MRSLQPSGFFGQPSASAIGFQVAMTRGESTTGSPTGDSGAVWPACDNHDRLRSATYAPEAGLKTCGFSSPARIA
jgi:hypothetical protein